MHTSTIVARLRKRAVSHPTSPGEYYHEAGVDPLRNQRLRSKPRAGRKFERNRALSTTHMPSVNGPVLANASSLANAKGAVGSKKLVATCARILLFRARVVEAAVFQHGFGGRGATAPRFISLAEVLSIAAREHHP